MLVIIALALLSVALAFRPVPLKPRIVSTKLGDLHLNTWTNSFLSAAEAVNKPDDYVYGAVNAPGWVLPLGAVLVIATAAIPVLLRPGENALEQQRINEEKTGTTFNKRKNKELR